MCGSGGVFFLSIESGGVIKTDETDFKDFVTGVEESAIAFKEEAALPGARAGSKLSSSLIPETAVFRKSLQNP